MKKILSLLSMLMITVMAFATDYTDQLKYEIGIGSNYYPVENAKGTLSITQYDNGNYQVTAKNCDFSSNPDVGSTIGNLGNLVCDGLSGTTDANGVTTIDVTECTAGLDGSSWIDMSSTKLFVKFKGDKAYATFTGKYRMSVFPYQWRTVSYTFGTDEGFDGGSTGGGETGGETSSIITVAENFVAKGESLGWEFDINWDTQKVVMSIDPSTCGTGTDHIIGLGSNPLAFRNNLHLYRSSSDKMLQGYCYYDIDNNTHKFSETNPILIEISKEKGFVVNGIAKIVPSTMGTFFSLTHLKMDTGEGSNNKSRATYNYVKVVPLNWTEVPPVTVDKTFTYDQDAFVGPNDTKGTANVKVNKMTDGTYTMEITAPVATKVGVITVGEDAKGRTTYMGEVESSVVSGVKYVVNGVVYEEGGVKHLYMTLTHDDDTYTIGKNPDAPKVVSTLPFENVAYTTSYNDSGKTTVTFTEMSDGTFPMTFVSEAIKAAAENLTKSTDTKGRTTYTGTAKRTDVTFDVTFTVKAVVYGEPAAQKLYMTMDNGSGFIVTVGDDPDYIAPVKCKNTLYVVENAKLLVETPKAEVVLQDKGDNKYDVTLPSFTAGDMTVPSITFEATRNEYKLTASNVSVPDVYSGDAAVVTMDGVFEAEDAFSALLTVKCGKRFDYEVGYGIKPFVATTKEYTAEWANVKVGDAEPVNFQNAKADYTEFAKGQYSLTFKDLTFGEKKIGDFTIKYVNKDEMDQLSTTASAGEWTRVETDQEVASKGDMPAISGFEGRLGGTGVLKVKFTIAVGGTTGNVAVDFGNKYEAPEPPVAPEVVDVVDADYNPAGQSWQKNDVSIDWDKQYIVAKLDLSTCKTGGAGPENVLAVGTDLTGWNNGPHYFFYYNKADKVLQYNYLHNANKSMNGGYANLSKAYIQLTDEVVTIEISKQGGLKVNGESALVKYIPSATNPSNNNTESWTTGDLETVFSGLWNLSSIGFGGCQGSTMSNATYKYVKVVPLGWTEPVTPPSVNDTKTFNEALYMVQGTTSYKIADSKVVVKEMSDETINMSLTYTIGESSVEYTSTELTKGTDSKDRTTYTGHVSNGTQTFDVAGVVYEKDNVSRLYMTMAATSMNIVVGENPDVVTPEVTEDSNKTYTSNLKMTEGEEDVVDMAEAKVNIIKYSDDSYKVTLKDVNILNKTQDLVFVGKALVEETAAEATEPLTIKAKSDEATTNVFGEQVNGTFEITEVSADEIKMGFVLNSGNFEYQGEFNYTDEETPEVYTNNLHIYDAAASETDLFQADQAKVEFLATETGGFKLTLKDVTLNEKKSDLVFTGTLPTPQPGGQDPLAEEGEGEVTPAEPAMVLNATADEATATFLGATSATAVFNVIMNDGAETENDAFALTFTITAGEKTLGGEFNYVKQDTPDEKYPVNFDKTANSTHNSRALNSFSLQQTGKDKQTESVYASKAAYEDHTSKVFTVEAGSELTASFDYTGEWMHSFVYIDFDNDGQFSYKEGQWDQTGTDLVAFSFYSLDSNPKNDASGYNSVGDELTGDARNTYVAPSFKAPAKAGEYRIRFKFDWNCILPGGSSSILSDGGGVWDATLKVVEPVVDGISTINVEAANGEAQLFTVDGVKLNKLQKGLNIVRTADGKVKKVLVK